MPKSALHTVAQYIAAAPKPSQSKLRQMRAAVKAAAPGATESMKWSMPAFSYRRILVTFAAHKEHIGFYPTPGVIEAFAKELKGYSTSKGGVRFPIEKPLPIALIKKMTACRAREEKKLDKKWRT